MNDYSNGSSRRRTGNTSSSRKSGSGSSLERERRQASSAGSRSHASGASRSSSSHTSSSSHSSHMSSSRGTSGRGNRGGHHGKRKKDLDLTQILMYIIGALIVVVIIALAAKGCGKFGGGKVDSTDVSESSSAEESSAEPQTTVDGISIDGLTQDQAKAAVLEQYGWTMKVTYKDKEASINNLMEENVNMLLEEIYAGDKKGEFSVKTDNLMEVAKAEAALISGNWNMVAKNGGISGYDKDTGKFTFTEGSNGVVIDQDKLAQDIVAAIQKKDYKAVLQAQTKEVSPEMTAAQLKEKYKTISTYTTKTTSNSNRNENIRLACIALNGAIVNPGQEFSFNNTTGARTEAKGYKPATAYLNGEIVQEPGGGVCQVSSTLYNAVIFAGLKSTERHAHSYEPSYVTPGEDAAVSFGGPDFKFVNNSDYPVAIKTSFADQVLTISIYGVPVLDEGVKVRMSSEKTGTLDPPAPTYEEDQTLQLDEEKVTKEAVPGSRWSTDLVTYKDGKEISREFFHNSSYRGKAAIIKRNTSGVVITTEATGESVDESVAESQPGVTDGSQGQEGESPAGPAGPGGETVSGQPVPESPVSPGGQQGGQGQQGGAITDGGQSPNEGNTPAPPMEIPTVPAGPGVPVN